MVHGSGLAAADSTVHLVPGRPQRTSQVPVDFAEGTGSFNYTIDQGPICSTPGRFPWARHVVVVTGAKGGRQLSTSFRVLSPPPSRPLPHSLTGAREQSRGVRRPWDHHRSSWRERHHTSR